MPGMAVLRRSSCAAVGLLAALTAEQAPLCTGSATKVGVGVGVGIGRRRRTRDPELAELARLEKELKDSGTTPSPELLELQELETALSENQDAAAGGQATKKDDEEESASSSSSGGHQLGEATATEAEAEALDDSDAAEEEEEATPAAAADAERPEPSSAPHAPVVEPPPARGEEVAALKEELEASEEALAVVQEDATRQGSDGSSPTYAAEVDDLGSSQSPAVVAARSQPSSRIVRREKKREDDPKPDVEALATSRPTAAAASALQAGAVVAADAKQEADAPESMEAAFARRQQQQEERRRKLQEAKAKADKENEESMDAAFRRRKKVEADRAREGKQRANATAQPLAPQRRVQRIVASSSAAHQAAAATSVAAAALQTSQSALVATNSTESLRSSSTEASKLAPALLEREQAQAQAQAALLAEAEELSSSVQITNHKQLQVLQADPAPIEMQQYMMIKSESVRAACFLKCLEYNPLSGKLYIATCHRGPNQKWKLKGETLVYEYDTQGGRICDDFQDWRKSSAGVAYQINLPGKPFGFLSSSWEDCRATCFSLPMCKQVVYRKATRACELMKAKLDSDQDGIGGQNVEYVSAHCEEGTGLPKCLENNAFLNVVTMADCNGKANQKWYFENHQMVSRADNKCLSLKNPMIFGVQSNAPTNEVSVTEHCDGTDSNQRWHWA
eukprot:TRINITY_DN63236_c0_g1_i1.p1 TRINITY_DN63236_c0_g1~~TRINITY_DN63236_c0_g1_i1.p1  ORF type:complete len:681 (-),score=229.79 TRINITY_DN63236_c0_g1_i1:8-2050(-)